MTHRCKSKKILTLTKCLLVFSLCILLDPISLTAQKNSSKNRFGAGIIVGINTSQINGDHLSGYDKFGGFFGGRALAKFNNTSELVIEILYQRKGSRDPNQFVPGQRAKRSISLGYIEIPILFHQKIEINSVQYSLEAGLAYAQLVGININENPGTFRYNTFTKIENEFNNQDIALVLGGGLMIKENIRIMMRYSYSLALLYENENPIINIPGDIPEINSLRNLQLTFGINYMF